MKNGLKVRPVFYWAVYLIHAHIAITELAQHSRQPETDPVGAIVQPGRHGVAGHRSDSGRDQSIEIIESPTGACPKVAQ